MTRVEIGVALAVPVALILPHLLPLHRASPLGAAGVWLLALALRALAALTLAALALRSLSDVEPVAAGLDWCWHEVLGVSHPLGFGEHPATHAAAAVPAVVLAASLAWLAFNLARAWLALRRRLAGAVAEGPLHTTIVEDDDPLVAITRLGRRRLLLSSGALGQLDAEELRASVAHEIGHLRRRHRPLLLAASLLAALARPLPGTAAAERGVRFQLERDADAYAVRQAGDPLALASAICKTAGAPRQGALVTLGGSGSITLRLDELLDTSAAPSRAANRAATALAAVLAAVTLALATTATAPAFTPPAADQRPAGHGCHHLG